MIYNRLGNIRFRDAQHYQARALSNRDIVVIGGSAGASVPLKEVLGGLSADVPAAVFVVLHIPARGLGILATVASGAGKLPVRPAENGLPIENGHIYLAAPDRHLLLADGHIVRRSPPSSALLHCTTVGG